MPNIRCLSIVLTLSVLAAPAAKAAGDAEHGKTLFNRCSGCHAATAQNRVGPGLAGVFGRSAGSVSNYHYSKAMVDYAKPWDDETLDGFLAAPTKALPGTMMTVAVPNTSDRADIIAYLKTLKTP